MSAGQLNASTEQAADALFAAFSSGTAIAPLTEADPDLDVDRAYAIQRALLDRHRECGRAVVGHKIGLTSPAIQHQLGVHSPDFGALLNSHVFASGDVLSRRAHLMVAPRLEPELAFVLNRDLHGPDVTAQQVLDATAAVHPVFEIIDSRIIDWRITLPDTVADNASCFGVIDAGAGGPPTALDAVEVTLERDGDVVQQGRGDAVLGHPAAAVAWLANELARFGEALKAGQLILSGSFTAAVDATPGRYRAHFSGELPAVKLEVVQ